jgi:hypothetical protein
VSRKRKPRHPAEVTVERLLAHLDRWGNEMDGAMRDHISVVIDWLDRKAGRP